MRFMMRVVELILVSCVMCCPAGGVESILSSQGAGASHSPGFAGLPAVKNAGQDRYAITFEVDTWCDVTVGIISADGRVLRHIGSGLLGANAPEPFQKNTLAQKIDWDGKDDSGGPVATGCSVRVELGLKPEFSRFLYQREPGVDARGPVSLACDRNGVVYVMWGHLWVSRFTGIGNISAFDRDGNYLRTVKPYRADWPSDKVSAVESLVTADGRRVPLTGPNDHSPFAGYLEGISGMARHTALITGDGRYIFVSGQPVADATGVKTRRLLSVGSDGSCPKESFFGPSLPEKSWFGDNFLALSPDDKYVYVSGTYHAKQKKPHHAVYRLNWKDTGFPKPFLGVECESGNDNRHFDTPRGLFTDAAGRVYVCDYLNDRIQIFDQEGKYLVTLPVKGPEQIVVHPKTGALYVLSVGDRGATDKYAEVTWELYAEKTLIKYKSWDDLTEVARLNFPKQARYFHDCGPIMALDSSAEKAVIWVCSAVRTASQDIIWKIQDEGPALKRVDHNLKVQEKGASFSAPAVAAARNKNEFYLADGGLDGVFRVKAGKGSLEKIPLGADAMNWFGYFDVAPDGTLYLSCGKLISKPRDMRWVVRRYSNDGAAMPFKDAADGLQTLGYHGGTYAGEKCGPFAVAPDGKIYVSECSELGGKARARVNLYSAEGALLKSGFIADMTHTAGPLAVDGRGNLYAGDAIKPAGKGAGFEFPGFLGADPRGHFGMWYGTVCRFGPEGGAFRHVKPDEPFTHAGGYPGGAGKVAIEGAKWSYYGMSPMPQSSKCECPSAKLSADGFGRVFVPDACTQSIQVLDPAGNLILRFGEYGNADAMGPGSAVPLPRIPLRFPSGVAVLDGYAAIADSHNRRVLEVQFRYASEATCKVP